MYDPDCFTEHDPPRKSRVLHLALVLAFGVFLGIVFCSSVRAQEAYRGIDLGTENTMKVAFCFSRNDAERVYREARKGFEYGRKMYMLLDGCRDVEMPVTFLVLYKSSVVEGSGGTRMPMSLALARVGNVLVYALPMKVIIGGTHSV